MNEDLKNVLEELIFTIQELDMSDEAKAEHLNLIQEVIKDPSDSNLQALLTVLEATSKIDNLSIQNTIDELKVAASI